MCPDGTWNAGLLRRRHEWRFTVDDFIIVYVTASGMEEAEDIAMQLIGSGLAPCINIIPACRSIYQWKGEVHKDEEVLMILKSRMAVFDDLAMVVQKNHSYDVPEIIAVPLAGVSKKYAAFLEGFLSTG